MSLITCTGASGYDFVIYFIPSKVQELEKEVNMFKAKFVTLLSDNFKVVVPSKFVCTFIRSLNRTEGPAW